MFPNYSLNIITNVLLFHCNFLVIVSCYLLICKGTVMQIMIASKQITNTEIITFIAVLIFKLLSRKVLLINRKDNKNFLKVGFLLRK